MLRASAPLSSSRARLRIYLFGQLRIVGVAGPIHLPTRKIESLFSYLVLHPAEHSREQLASLLWGNVVDTHARASLRNALPILRSFLGNDLLIADRALVQLNPRFPLWADALEFQKLVSDQTTIEDWQSAIDLYQGDLLADLYDDWILPEREHFHMLYLETLLRFTQQLRAQSEYRRAIQFAQKALASDAANERAHQQLMFCYLALGDRSAALEQYEECKRALKRELAVEPMPETTALFVKIKQTIPESKSSEAMLTNLPVPLSNFVGRQEEMRQVKDLLWTARLVTLTGAGGSGKTRLAIQVATDLTEVFKDGVWWVELANWMESAQVPQAFAKALGIPEVTTQSFTETLAQVLRPRQLLLVLDNCEHLVGACAELANSLLIACPYLRILATSREAFGLTGERVFHVPTLSLPEAGSIATSHTLMEYDAIHLFHERASAVRSGYVSTEQDLLAVAQLCQRLDGIPLAIELAAVRVKTLTVPQIAARLDDRFRLLTQGQRTELPRRQTLRAAIDWSYDLLTAEERILFQRLSVFAGSWTLEAAESICSDARISTTEVLDLLARLADKSILTVEARGKEARYNVLETLRQYASQKLGEIEERRQWLNRHLEFFLAVAEKAKPELWSGQQSIWLERLDQEHDNLRAALNWSLEDKNSEGALRLAGALWRFWEVRGYVREGRSWLERALSLGAAARGPLRAAALRGSGNLARQQGDYTRAIAFLEEALSLRREMGHRRDIARLLDHLGEVARYQGEYARAVALHEEALALHRQQGNPAEIANSLSNLGMVALDQGDYRRALRLHEQSLKMRREVGDRLSIAFSLNNLGLVAHKLGDHPRAAALYEECLALYRELRDKRGIAYTLHNLGDAAKEQGALDRAADLYAQSLKIKRELGDRRGIASTLARQGDLAARREDYQMASAMYRESLGLRAQLSLKQGIADCLARLGEVAWLQARARRDQHEALERAARLLGASTALRDAIQQSLPQAELAEYEHIVSALRERLGANVFAQAWAEGRGLTLDQAVQLAMGTEML